MPSVSDETCPGTSPKSLNDPSGDRQSAVLDCGVCGDRFSNKRQLRVHIHTHLRKPRIVLRRVAEPTRAARRHLTSDTYWLDPEKKGSLKLTLKKQSVADSLKLTLKKSSESEDFTVVNSNSSFNSGVGNYQEEDVAGAKENDHRDHKAAEGSLDESFGNVMVDQQVGFFLSENARAGQRDSSINFSLRTVPFAGRLWEH